MPLAEPPADGLRGLLLDMPWDGTGPAIDTARTLLRLPPRQPGDDY